MAVDMCGSGIRRAVRRSGFRPSPELTAAASVARASQLRGPVAASGVAQSQAARHSLGTRESRVGRATGRSRAQPAGRPQADHASHKD